MSSLKGNVEQNSLDAELVDAGVEGQMREVWKSETHCSKLVPQTRAGSGGGKTASASIALRTKKARKL